MWLDFPDQSDIYWFHGDRKYFLNQSLIESVLVRATRKANGWELYDLTNGVFLTNPQGKWKVARLENPPRT